MNEMTTADLSRKIAELVGDEGFLPAAKCSQGHENPLPFSKAHPVPIGEFCRTCSVNEASERLRRTKYPYGHGYLQREWDAVLAEIDAEGHPEWRIGRGEPKPYAEDPALLIPLVEQWFAKHPGIELEITVVADSGMLRRHLHVRSSVVLGLMRFTGVDELAARRVNTADEFTSALADIWLAAVERWGRDA